MTSSSVRRSTSCVRNRVANDFIVTAIRKSAGRRIVRAIITTRQHHKSFGGSCPYRQTANNPPFGSAKRPGTGQRPPCPARCCRFGDRSRTIARNSLTARDGRCHSKHALRLPYSRGSRHRCCVGPPIKSAIVKVGVLGRRIAAWGCRLRGSSLYIVEGERLE